MQTIKVNTYYQNPEVSAADQPAPLPMEITLTDAETPRISPETSQTDNLPSEGANAVREVENEPKRLSNGAFDIPTVDVSLYRDYKSGVLTLRQCAEEFCECGWTNYIDEDFARRKFAQIEQRELMVTI